MGQHTHDLGLANALVKTGGFDEAGVLFADAEKFLLAMEKTADSLPVQFYLAIAGIRGERDLWRSLQIRD